MTKRLTIEEKGRAMRLAGVGFTAPKICEAVPCSLAFARRMLRERNERVATGKARWFDTGEHPPPEAVAGRKRGVTYGQL